jgi:hypothetical protein
MEPARLFIATNKIPPKQYTVNKYLKIIDIYYFKKILDSYIIRLYYIYKLIFVS